MKLAALSCGILAIVAASAARGQDSEAAWSDEVIWTTVGKTHGFENTLRTIIFETPEVRHHVRRGGVMLACRVIADFVDQSALAATEEYRAVIVAEARLLVPEGKTFPDRISVHPSGFRYGRLLDRVERKAPELFAKVPAWIETRLLADLAALPAIEGEWRGLFADWNFAGPNQSVWANACMLSTLRDPSNAKRVFDGFYSEHPSQ